MPRTADPGCERVVHLHDPGAVVGDDDEIDERVERVFEQASLLDDLLEELNVLERERELSAEVVDRVDELLIVEIPGVALQDDRAERAPPPAKGGDKDAAIAWRRRQKPRTVESKAARRNGVRL